MTELELIIQDLDGIGTELFNKYGAESYNIRCKLHDIKDQLKAINYSQCCKSDSEQLCDCKKHSVKTNYDFEICTKCGNEFDD